MRSEKEMRDRGFLRYNELSGSAKKEAYERFAWDFVNEKPFEATEEEILSWLAKHWFTENGGTYVGSA
jgi:hypothetical protein